MYNGFILSLIFLFILFFAGIILSFLTSAFLIPIFFTPRKVLKEIIDVMNLKEGQVLVDLGSGDGRVLFAARKSAKIIAHGYEVSPVMALVSNLLKRLNFGLDNSVSIEVASLFDVNLTDVDKVYCHLSERAMEILKGKLKQELPKGAKVYSYEYPIPGLKATKTNTLSNGVRLFVYSY